MNDEQLKFAIRERIWQVVDRHDFIHSATLTGSFVESRCLDGISDIDCVVVVDGLNAQCFSTILSNFDAALRPLLKDVGYDFLVNPTLGPLKFNSPNLAVLHLMLYSPEARVAHARQSPFTSLDWQRSDDFRKRRLSDVYPVFGLQPRHFLGGRRGVRDYLTDLRAGVVSYRELVCDDSGYTERKLGKPMTTRDRHEFAYHVMKFLMTNFLKLTTRTNFRPENEAVLNGYFERFPEGATTYIPYFRMLAARKKTLDFDPPVPNLESTLESFALALESQFRKTFVQDATRHLVFRHVPTRLNLGVGGSVVFQGRSDEELLPLDNSSLTHLVDAVSELNPTAVYASPAVRCRATLAQLARLVNLSPVSVDHRLQEIDYGELEGRTVNESRHRYPEVFAAWGRGEDPQLPGGEAVSDVLSRITEFTHDVLASAEGNTLVCTHNVVIRCLIGTALGVPQREWHRLRVPHAAPITLVQTREFGLFVDIPEGIEQEIFSAWEPTRVLRAA